MHNKRLYVILTTLLAFAMLLAACTAVPAAPPAAPAGGESAAPAEAANPIKIGLVTDVGRVNDRSFNQSAWDGVKQVGKHWA